MEELAKTLQGLKVPELKAKCKELKIPNFSKLSKADLVTKILELSKTTIIDLSARPPASKIAGPPSNITHTDVSNDATATDAGPTMAADRGKEGKAGKAPSKRKEAPTKKKTKCKIPTTSKGSGPDLTIVVASQGPVLTNALIAANVKTTPTPVSPVPTIPPNYKTATAKPIPKPKASLLKTSVVLPQGPKTKTGPPKIKARTAAQAVKSRPRFQGLLQTKTPQVALRPVDKPVLPEPKIASPTERIKFTETHFLNTLFTCLHKFRAKSIAGPGYPCPASFTQSPSSTTTSHLAFQGFHPDVYAKTDARGFMVAVRFWIARLHSYMQLGSGEAWSSNAKEMGMLGPDLATWPPVMAVAEVTDEIWAVMTEEEGKIVKYLVIGEVGEVVASSKGEGNGDGLPHGCRVRGDWKKYLEQESGSRRKLGSMIKTKDSYAFPSGVSLAWSAGPGRAEHLASVAHRAVLASCALNSFSGEKLSSLAMNAAYLGRPATGGPESDDLDLYLPESHQILSVHRPATLHPALAIVHRSSGYSEFVLAETGQVVGIEDEGVVSLYQGLIGCDAKGSADSTGQAAFWKGWESRMKFFG